VNLIRGDSLAAKERQSYVCKSSLLRRSRGPIFALHHAVIGRRSAKGNTIAAIMVPIPVNALLRATPPLKW
jgi:hypothetical protein